MTLSSGASARRSGAADPRRWNRVDTLVLLVVAVLITVASVVGLWLNANGHDLVLPGPPLLAFWHPHVGWGTPLVFLCVALGLLLHRVVHTLGWRAVLLLGWLLNLAWMVSLVLIDGLRDGWIDVLLDPNEYLRDLPRITSAHQFLATFTDYLAYRPGLPEDQVWTTHVAGHPPLATLMFWFLARIGLPGGFWAGALCILGSSAVAVALPVTVRTLGAPAAARRLIPFVALFPGAVWMAVSADGLFAGVATAGLALACVGAVRRRWWASLLGGVLLGTAVFLNYGLVLFGVVALAGWWLSSRVARGRVFGPWLVTGAGALAVAAVHLALGFNWFTGLAELRVRYYQGIASQRPYAYFVWANLAAWLISCSPLLAVSLVRAVRAVRAGWSGLRSRAAPPETLVVALLALSGLAAAMIADLSAMSKAETERIWLAFGVAAYTCLALLRGRLAAVALVACALWAITVNHLLDTGW